MKKSLGLLTFAAVAVLGVIVSGCQRSDSDRSQKELATSSAELRALLESGTVPEKEVPFVPRPFKPSMGDRWLGHAVSYGPYREGQAPGVKGPSDAELLEDLRIIAGHWNLIRVYGADEDTRRILRVIDANELPIKVMLGTWLTYEEDSPERRTANIDQVARGIHLANQYPETVIAVSVGNETQVYWSAHRMQPQSLIRYIRAVRSAVSVPVTTADDYNFWNKRESARIADEIDFVVLHMHPVWNGQTLQSAIGWLDSTYDDIQSRHPKKNVIVGETGWATQYNPEKTGPGEQGTLVKGEVSVAAQGVFLIQLHHWVETRRITTFLFEAFDEPWKGGGQKSPPNEIEKHWGVFYENRTPKESFVEYLKHVRSPEN